jgi:hypothetical protein
MLLEALWWSFQSLATQGKLKTFTGKGQLFANCYGHAYWMEGFKRKTFKIETR